MTSTSPPPEASPAPAPRYASLRTPLLSTQSLGGTIAYALTVFVLVTRNPWVPFMIPIKVALLLGVTWFWVAAIVVRLPRIATRKEGLLLRGGLIWGVKVIAWHHIDSVVVWHGSPSRGAGMRDMIGVKMKRGVPQSVKFPEKERKRGRITDPGFGTVPREVPLNSIALDALRPEDVVKLLRESHPRVHVLDLRDPLQVVDLSAEVDGPN